jgi:hypothetical protein
VRELVTDLFLEPADAICLTTNGSVKRDGAAVMGRGVALMAKRLWYGIDRLLGRRLKKQGNVVQVLTLETDSGLHYLRLPRKEGGPLLCPVPWHIVAFPVKEEWQEKADLDLIGQSARALRRLIKEQKWKRVLLPRPGCGNGRLSWAKVRPVLNRHFAENQHLVVVSTAEEEESQS